MELADFAEQLKLENSCNMDLKELIHIIVKPLIKKQHIRAKVLSVDTSEQTCEVESLQSGGTRFEVKLRVISDGENSGFILYPKVGSLVILGILDNNEADCFISQYSAIAGMLVVIKDGNGNELQKFELGNDGKVKWNAVEIHFDGATNGLVKVPDLVQKLNAIEQDLNAIKTVFTGWTPIPNDGGAALKAAASSWAGSSITQTVDSDIKHDKVEY